MEEKNTKTCPFCGKEILIKAKKCKYCGEWLYKNNNEPQQEISQPQHDTKTLQKNVQNRAMKLCPYCCQEIPIEAQKCIHCGEWIKEKPQKENSVYKTFQIIFGILIVLIGVLLECISGGSGAGLVFAFIAAIILGIYFLPTTIADEKRHRKTTEIFIINLFFGGTVIGWVIALIWALNDNN